METAIKWGLAVWGGLIFFFMVFGWIAGKRRDAWHRARVVQASKHGWWRWKWSEDGWVRKCKICGAVQFGGDDYEGGPDEGGLVQAG